MLNVFLDALFDSLKVLAFVFVIHVLLSFFEGKIAHLLEKKNRFAPLLGSLFGVVPECGVSVVAADLYTKRHITMGTLVSVFLACSDEALPLLFADVTGRWYMGFALLGIKIVAGFIVGFTVDLFYTKNRQEVETHLEHCEGETGPVHCGCCGHEIDDEKENPWHEHLVHPLIHSLKIFAYVFVINMLFGVLLYYVGDDNINNFLSSNYYFSPLIAVAVGLIPNCASSVLIAQSYVLNRIPFGALLAGLSVNAGLGMIVLYKDKKNLKDAFIILGILVTASIGLGYLFLWVN